MSTHEERMRKAIDKHTERLVKEGAPTKEGWRPLTPREATDRAHDVADRVERTKREKEGT